ncbi:MAG: hypothetical protein IKY21_05185 [Clostridia bacterium]|jgi:hypothetical protein|nr:hypothetical protein [Clostridia bacterium]
MKKTLILVLTLIMVFAFCACSDSNGEIIVAQGLKLAGNQAGNQAVEYSFTYPEEWSLIRNDGVIEIQFDCNESNMYAQYATISVLSFSLQDPTQAAKPYWTEHEKQLQTIYTDYKLIDTKEYLEEKDLLDDVPALKVKYSGKINDITYLNEQIIACREGQVYLITLVVPEESYEKVENAMNVVKSEFTFVK